MDLPSPDPDISRAWTLPSRFYADPGVFSLLKEKVLARSWQFVGDLDLVKTPGQAHPFTLLEGCLDEPLLLTRDMDDRVHCLTNVCTHRGTVLVESPTRERTLTCRYHGRRFGLDGAFKSMPEFEGTRDFPSESDSLKKVPFATWKKFVFASLDPQVPLDDLLRPLAERIGWLPLEECVFDPSRSKDYLVRANWALYCDNYLEGFHIPFVHAGLNAVLDYGNYHTELFPWCNLQLGISKGGDHCFEPPAGSPDHGKQIAAYYYWIFPNTMFNVYPWGVSVNVVRPLGVDLTRISFLSFVRDPSKLDSGAGAGLDRVEREDEAVVEAVQRGMRSRHYDRGRYSPTREQGVHHFHRLLVSALTA